MLKVIRTRDYDDMSRKAANVISAQVILKPDSVLGLATGSTPLGIYRTLIGWYQKGDLDFAKVRSVNLDEYQGLPREHDQSYYYFMNENFFKHINIDREQTHLPNGMNMDAEGECARYHQVIESMGGVDLQLLGIGNNGHIGFNEPTDNFPAAVHTVQLTESTINANSRLFERREDVPTQAITMGIGTIMKAKKIVLLANGPKKAQTIHDTVYGPITPKVPASVLRLHPDVTIFVDEEAGALLKK